MSNGVLEAGVISSAIAALLSSPLLLDTVFANYYASVLSHLYYIWSLLKAFCVVQTAAVDAPAVLFSDVHS